MKRLCNCLISMAISRSNIKSKYKVDYNFIFISVEKKYFGNILIFLKENPGTNQNFIGYNVQVI